MTRWPTHDEAEAILTEWTAGKNLRKHAWAVEAAMPHWRAMQKQLRAQFGREQLQQFDLLASALEALSRELGVEDNEG